MDRPSELTAASDRSSAMGVHWLDRTRDADFGQHGLEDLTDLHLLWDRGGVVETGGQAETPTNRGGNNWNAARILGSAAFGLEVGTAL